jgi:mRNA-degrading endonuclease toxin of MazEF toxin-antitoxin module
MSITTRRTVTEPDGTKTIRIQGIDRGMVFWVRVADGKGSELRHPNGESPWLIVSRPSVHNSLPLVQAVPLTSQIHQQKSLSYRILLPLDSFSQIQGCQRPLSGDSLALVEQVRVLAHERIQGEPCARLKKEKLAEVEVALKFVLGIP